MNIRQLFLPRPARVLFKKTRRIAVAARANVLTWKLRLGFPRWVARYIAARSGSGRVAVSKQGLLGIITQQEYLRFAQGNKARQRLREEHEAWQLMRRCGFADLVARFMELRELPEGLVLATEPLRPMAKEARHGYLLPVARRLASAAAPLAHDGLPPSVAAGLSLAHQSFGTTLPVAFANEGELVEAFRKPLLTGLSHQDLHWRNVLDRDSRPVLIDLKKIQPGRILSLDLLNMACLSLAAENGGNVVNQAYDLHQRNWRVPMVADILELVDLPRHVWGPAYVLHVMGIYAEGKGLRASGSTAILFRRLLTLNWNHP